MNKRLSLLFFIALVLLVPFTVSASEHWIGANASYAYYLDSDWNHNEAVGFNISYMIFDPYSTQGAALRFNFDYADYASRFGFFAGYADRTITGAGVDVYYATGFALSSIDSHAYPKRSETQYSIAVDSGMRIQLVESYSFDLALTAGLYVETPILNVVNGKSTVGWGFNAYPYIGFSISSYSYYY